LDEAHKKETVIRMKRSYLIGIIITVIALACAILYLNHDLFKEEIEKLKSKILITKITSN